MKDKLLKLLTPCPACWEHGAAEGAICQVGYGRDDTVAPISPTKALNSTIRIEARDRETKDIL